MKPCKGENERNCIMTLTKLIAVAIAFMVFGISAGAAVIDIRINGEYIKTDAGVYVENGITLAPVRSICSALGADVEWNEDMRTASVDFGEEMLVFYENSALMLHNGSVIYSPVESCTIDGRMYVPVRFLGELIGFEVDWDDKYQNAELTKADTEVGSEYILEEYNHDELTWLARIIYAEARGEDITGQIAVGNVVLNRVASALYPNTIYGVIFDTKNGVQFEPVLNGSVYNDADASTIQAAKRALLGESAAGECLFFFNPAIASSNWISTNRTYYSTIGGHEFYL